MTLWRRHCRKIDKHNVQIIDVLYLQAYIGTYRVLNANWNATFDSKLWLAETLYSHDVSTWVSYNKNGKIIVNQSVRCVPKKSRYNKLRH